MTSWRVSLQPDDLERFKGSQAFAEILTLGRIANLLRTTIALGLTHGPGDDSASDRARASATFLLSGLVAEALPVLERSGQHFRHLPSFKESVTPILKDPQVSEVRSQWLSPLRNQAVFHNDREVSETGLSLMRPDVSHDIVRGSTQLFMDGYYPLADAVAVAYVINKAGSGDDAAAFLASASFHGARCGHPHLHA